MLDEIMELAWSCNSMNEVIEKSLPEKHKTCDILRMWNYVEDISDFYKNKYNGDALFFSGKIHGCDDEVYIIYLNLDSHIPSWEIEIINCDQVLRAYEESGGDALLFWDALPDICQGCWLWCNVEPENPDDYMYEYSNADRYITMDNKSMNLLVEWARERKKYGK